MRIRWDSAATSTQAKKETDFKKKIEISQIKKQIEVLLTFIPDEILYLRKEELCQVQHFVGVLLFADVSGFTPLCEKYNKTGKGGIYRLTATLNAYIGAIVEVIYFYGGDVLKFSGDAFLALWKANPDICLYQVIHEVIVCALCIQQTLGFFETEVNVLLKVKLAISCGNMTFSVIGDDIFKYYVILGQAINDVKAAEHVSVSGDVVISPGAWGHLAEESYEVTYAQGGNVKVWRCVYKPSEKEKKQNYLAKNEKCKLLCEKHIQLRNTLHSRRKFDNNMTDSKLIEMFVQSLPPRGATKVAVQTWISSELSPFIIKPVRDQVEEKQELQYLTEMREVTIQFINIVPTSYAEEKLVVLIDLAYQLVCKIVSAVLGVVNKVSLFDKDAMLLVLFGLKGIKHELESQNALQSGYKIRKSISQLEGVKSVSVGITNGLVYCGVVGHPLRKEYTVIGGAVNKAARIMCAYEHKVTCDHETYKNSKLSSTYFKLQTAFKLKGIEKAGHIFEYNEDFEENLVAEKVFYPPTGRDSELNRIDMVLTSTTSIYTGIVMNGKPKSGKSYIIDQCVEKYRNKKQTCAYLKLLQSNQKPFFLVSAAYQQFFDCVSKQFKKNSAHLANLKKNLWDLTEILQKKFENRKEFNLRRTKVADKFNDLCTASSTIPFLFVDDIQYIDSKSHDVLQVALNLGNLRMISSGNFEENNTWDTLFKFTSCPKLKVIDIEPLDAELIPVLICQFLHVYGASWKLCTLIEKTCEGRPGWMQSCILKLVNNGGIKIEFVRKNEEVEEYICFPDPAFLSIKYKDNPKSYDNAVVPVVSLTQSHNNASEDLTLAAISLDLFDSFTPYEQLIIKTAAVLGEIFSRALLYILLKYPNTNVFTKAIKNLFDEEVFDCGSKYISSGGKYSREITCVCFNAGEDIADELKALNFPSYAFCKNLHFKNKTLRTVAYELIPANQRKELHLRATDILENQNNLCPSCQVDNSGSIIRLKKYKATRESLSQHRLDTINKKQSTSSMALTEKVKDIIRSNIRQMDVQYIVHGNGVIPPQESDEILSTDDDDDDGLYRFTSDQDIDEDTVPARKVWDPTVCFCLEILTRVYSDLIYHAEQAGDQAKKIFFIYENSQILFFMDEIEDAIELLKEGSELCVNNLEKTIFSSGFFKFVFSKICYLLAECNFILDNLGACQNYIILTLRQHQVPTLTFNYTYMLNCFIKSSKTANQFDRNQIAKCLVLFAKLMIREGKFGCGKIFLEKSVQYYKKSKYDIKLLCDTYSTIMDLFTAGKYRHTCEHLERYLAQAIIDVYARNELPEMFTMCQLGHLVFMAKFQNGNLLHGAKIAYRVFELNKVCHAFQYQLDLLPTFAILLTWIKRIEEAVSIMRILRGMGQDKDEKADLSYYSFCLNLQIESNFILEPLDDIIEWANNYFAEKKNSTSFSRIEEHIAINMCTHYSRKRDFVKAIQWRRIFNPAFSSRRRFISVLNCTKFLETILLVLTKDIECKTSTLAVPIDRIDVFMKECFELTNVWISLKPRMLHYKAYYKKILDKNAKVNDILDQVMFESKKMDNLLDYCWANLSKNGWVVGTLQSDEVTPNEWYKAIHFGPNQWSSCMYMLPLPVAMPANNFNF